TGLGVRKPRCACGGLVFARQRGCALRISPSPAALDDTVLESTRTLEPAAIIELVVRLSVLQMLHRLGAYYRA
ncbi:MAG TPA: hypothetical protein VMU79_13140, partial [Casimicrobiaceae bacterium]|nr:hypothetical protein [Casimicrobiaceae bacterium]